MALDRHLFVDNTWNPRTALAGLDGQRHYAVARTTVLAEFAGVIDKVSEADQSAGMFPLARLGHVVAEKNFRLRELDKITRRRLGVAIEGAKRHGAAIRLMAATPTIDFEGQLDQPKGRRLVRMGPPNADRLVIVELIAAIRRARDANVHVVVLPELSVSEEAEAAVQAELAMNRSAGHPILTVMGLTHRPCRDHEHLNLNEAVVLGYDGRELLRHRKLATVAVLDVSPVVGQLEDGEKKAMRSLVREATRIADEDDRFELLPTPFGLLATVICLDLFHSTGVQALGDGGASLVAVASLSPVTTPHQRAASVLSARQWAVTIVANRPFVASAVGRLAAPSFIYAGQPHAVTSGAGDELRVELYASGGSRITQ